MSPLILIVTYQCNLACVYCPVPRKNLFIKRESAFKAVDLYLRSTAGSKGRIKIFGGEPLINLKLLKEIISHIRQKSSVVQIELTTNGILLEDSLLAWLKNHKVRLSISLDGDEKNHSLNRKGTSRLTYRKILHLIKKLPAEAIVNMVVSPNTSGSFLKNFTYLYDLGVKRFNILPAAYQSWSQKELKTFENQLDLVSFFISSHPDIYLKNSDINNELFFFNTGIVVDVDGSIFFTNAIMLKEFQAAKENIRIGNINEFNAPELLDRLDKEEQIKKIESATKISFKKGVLRTNKILDSLLNNLVEKTKPAEKYKRVDIKIGFQCNNHCFFCVQGNKRERCSFRQKAEIEKDLTEARKTCDSIVFTGGEPTLHPCFLDLVRFSYSLKFKTIQIQTNGRMFAYKKFCEELIKAGANEFAPALHGHTAALHDSLTKVSGSFSQTVQGIKNLKSLGQKVITNTVITKTNYRHLPEIARLFVSLGVDQFQFAFVHIIGTAWENRDSIVPKKSEIMPSVKKGLDIGIKAGKRVMTEAIPYCFMQNYEQYVAEQVIPDAMVIEDGLKIDDYKKYRINDGKIKGAQCKKCLYFQICEGPWREYPQLFGWKEFKPISKESGA